MQSIHMPHVSQLTFANEQYCKCTTYYAVRAKINQSSHGGTNPKSVHVYVMMRPPRDLFEKNEHGQAVKTNTITVEIDQQQSE
jgi:hypothetical protein